MSSVYRWVGRAAWETPHYVSESHYWAHGLLLLPPSPWWSLASPSPFTQEAAQAQVFKGKLGGDAVCPPQWQAPSIPVGLPPPAKPVQQAECTLQAPCLICNLGSWGHSFPDPPSSPILSSPQLVILGGLAAQGLV